MSAGLLQLQRSMIYFIMEKLMFLKYILINTMNSSCCATLQTIQIHNFLLVASQSWRQWGAKLPTHSASWWGAKLPTHSASWWGAKLPTHSASWSQNEKFTHTAARWWSDTSINQSINQSINITFIEKGTLQRTSKYSNSCTWSWLIC